jgi:hypothetical protein
MVPSKKTWKEKRIAREENGSKTGSGSEEGHGEQCKEVDVNMVFHLPAEFWLPE